MSRSVPALVLNQIPRLIKSVHVFRCASLDRLSQNSELGIVLLFLITSTNSGAH